MAMDSDLAYTKALKSGQRAAKNAISAKQSPYLPVLEELCPIMGRLSRVSLGVVSVPMQYIIGTATAGRTAAFACNFMPLLEVGTEFYTKWQTLYESISDEGLRDPVKVLEYKNRFYAVEGNKRISVMKFLESPAVECDVTRLIPEKDGKTDTNIYFEFIAFYADSGINTIEFSEEGCYDRLIQLVGQEKGVKWSEDAVKDFNTAFYRFTTEFNKIELPGKNVTAGDAFLMYLELFGYSSETMQSAVIAKNVSRIRTEVQTISHEDSINLKLDAEGTKPGLLHQLTRSQPSVLKVCFINNRNPEVSGWTYWHELGKNHVDAAFGKEVRTQTINDVKPEDCEQVIENALNEGANVIFTTSPVLLPGAMKAALAHPQAKILNCSLMPEYHTVRSYYLRMYEAKFILGAIAGAVAEDGKIGYIADYPVYGVPASINAFALGARFTNPRATVYLEWSTLKDRDPEWALAKRGVSVICNRDIAAPSFESNVFGLYLCHDDHLHNIAMPVWQWGSLYEDLLRRIRNGMWDTDTSSGKEARAVNYWWGLDEDAVDVYYTSKLDAGTKRMAEFLKESVKKHTLPVFAESIRDQAGNERCHNGETLTPAQILSMDWFCEHVIGTIPELSELKEEAVPFVSRQGLKVMRAPDVREIGWQEKDSDEKK